MVQTVFRSPIYQYLCVAPAPQRNRELKLHQTVLILWSDKTRNNLFHDNCHNSMTKQPTFISTLSPQAISKRRDTTRASPRCLSACARTPPLSTLPSVLRLGDLNISPPVVLAPMAGVTNYPFRKLCRKYGAALYVSEMVLASSLLSGKENGRLRFGQDEHLRSAQLYGTDPSHIAEAARILIEEHHVKHIDLNFGCPAPKVLRQGGGAAVAANTDLLRRIASSAVNVASPYGVPVTAKMRAGLSDSNLTYLNAGQVLQECGVAAITLHTRTAKEMYSTGTGRTNWKRIRHLQQILEIPVIGNGDVFTADDAVDMLRETGAAGVAIGRGCLGRPWLFRDLCEALETGRTDLISTPGFEDVQDTLLGHVRDAIDWMVDDDVDEGSALKSMRKWFGWYWRGYKGLPCDWTTRMCQAATLQELENIMRSFDGKGVNCAINEVVTERGKVGSAP